MKKTLFAQDNSHRNGRFSMNAGFRRNTLAYCVGLALAQMSACAVADSGVGQNTTLGNAMRPAPINPSAQQADGAPDPEGMGTREPAAHTPSGQFYNIPYAEEEAPTGTSFSGSVEAGVQGVGGDKNAAMFRTYKDVKSGAVVNSFSLQGEKPDTATYVEASGGGVGRDDQFYGLNFGRYNEWKASVFYNETTHVFTTTAYPLFNGIGTGNLTLPSNVPAAGGATFAGYATTATHVSGTGQCTAIDSATPIANSTACFKSPLIGGNTTAYSQAAINHAAGVQIAADLAGQGPTTLSLIRKNGGVTFDIKLDGGWKLFASATTEKRKGARPFGEVQGGGGGTSPIELAEPIDYDTHDFKAGVRYVDKLTNFNLLVNANLFRNNIGSLTFQNPFLPAAQPYAALVQNGTFDLYPNNDYYNIKGDFARNFPDFYKARFTATVSASTMRQNDQLLPPSANGGIAGTAGQTDYVNLNLWNTTAALSQQTANARIDTRLIDLGLSLSPTKDLDVRGKYRYYDTDNKTTYFACNPTVTAASIVGLANPAYVNAASGCAGVWGRLLNDGGGSAIITAISAANGTPNSNNIIRNIPYETRQTNAGFSADYRINGISSFNAAYEREDIKRAYRERENTWEDKLKLGYVNRGIGDGTLRLSAEADRRRGDPYDPTSAYYQFLGVALPLYGASTSVAATNYVLKLADLRKFDVADRDQAILNARINYPLQANLDLGFSGQVKTVSYPNSADGRKDGQDQNSLNIDLNYLGSSERIVSGFYSYQVGKMKQANVYPGGGANACTLGAVIGGVTVTAANAEIVCGTAADNSTFNPVNAWSENSKDTNHVLGVKWDEAFGKYRLQAGYQQSLGRTAIHYDYTAGVGVMPPVAAAALVGNNADDMKTNVKTLELNLLIPIDKQLSTRLMFRHERGTISDYHYTGLTPANLVMWAAGGASAGTAGVTGVMMDTGPQDYRVTTVGATLLYKF